MKRRNTAQVLIRKIETIGLDEYQYDKVIAMLGDDLQSIGNLYLDEVDADELDLMIDQYETSNPEYSEFLAEAQEKDATVYSLSHGLMNYPEPLGYVSVRFSDVLTV
jgi:hypothetical protein